MIDYYWLMDIYIAMYIIIQVIYTKSPISLGTGPLLMQIQLNNK